MRQGLWTILIATAALAFALCPTPAESASPPAAAAEPAGGPATRPTTQPASAAMARRVAELIRQMTSPRYRDRQAASDALQAMGEDVLPLLEPYRTHPDPEVAARVRHLFSRFVWMSTGVVVTRVLPASQAERLGVRAGDVFLRVGELDVLGLESLQEIDYQGPRTYYTWREGTLRRFRAGPGLLGAYCAEWNRDAGGTNHARGLSALGRRDYDEAYRRLQGAYDAGMRDPYTLMRLWGLADYHLDHAKAMQFHRAFRQLTSVFPQEWSRREINEDHFGLPMTSSHTDYLLVRMRNEPFSLRLYDSLLSYFLGAGRNLPLARQVLQRDWPVGVATSIDYLAAHTNAQLRLALFDRRWDNVLARYRPTLTDAEGHAYAMAAYLQAGDADKALLTGRRIAASYRLNPYETVSGELLRRSAAGTVLSIPQRRARERAKLDLAANAIYAWALQLARDRPTPAHLCLWQTTLSELVTLPGFCGQPAWRCLERTDLAGRAAAVMAEHPPTSSSPEPRTLYLRLLALSPGLTAESWAHGTAVLPRGADLKPADRVRHARVLARLGHLAEAQKVLAAAKVDAPALARALAWRRARKPVSPKLGSPQPASPEPAAPKPGAPVPATPKPSTPKLRVPTSAPTETHDPCAGIVFAWPDAEGKTRWLARYDGTMLRLDADASLEATAGLPARLAPDPARGDGLLAAAGETIYRLHSVVYRYGPPTRRWQQVWGDPITSAPGEPLDAHLALLAGYLVRHRSDLPTPPGGHVRLRSQPGPDGWRMHLFADDLTLATHPASGRVIDLPSALAKATGRDGRVAVYRGARLDRNRYLLPTAAGAWLLDARGRLQQIDLPHANQRTDGPPPAGRRSDQSRSAARAAATQPAASTGRPRPNNPPPAAQQGDNPPPASRQGNHPSPTDVTTLVLDWPRRGGKRYIGIVPQQGGDVFEFDLATGRAKRTAGYAGRGPDDAFAATGPGVRRLWCHLALQRLLANLLSGDSKPAHTPPPDHKPDASASSTVEL